MNKSAKIILVDADVISHFISCGELLLLHKILEPHTIVIPDIVYKEITRIPSRKNTLDNVINLTKKITIMPFPDDSFEIKMEFALIKKNNPLIGDGERACMAIAKYNKNIIASSNFRDIVPYCQANNIFYLGTLDILYIALKNNIFDNVRCDLFISTAKTKNNAKFPHGITSITQYIPKDLSFL